MKILFVFSLLLPVASSIAAGLFINSSQLFAFIQTGDPLMYLAILAASFAVTAFIFSQFTHEYSWVDRLWSVCPILYSGFLVIRGWPDQRLMLMSFLIALWGIRLSYNFARKGGYSGVEDYRWAEVHKTIKNPVLWQIFNFFFISFYQHALILSLTFPMYNAYQNRGKPLSFLDLLIGILFIGFLGIETLADQQQWNFHKQKKAAHQYGKVLQGDVARGFLSSGLFRNSRHPNYFCEIMIWWTVYLFGVSASGKLFHWSIIGPVLLVVLFQGSSGLTEKISGRKYPEYASYQKVTRKIIPWLRNK